MSEQKKEQKGVAPEVWRRVFQTDQDGAAILEELFQEFVYREQLVTGDHDETCARLGEKRLVMFIAGKCAS